LKKRQNQRFTADSFCRLTGQDEHMTLYQIILVIHSDKQPVSGIVRAVWTGTDHMLRNYANVSGSMS